MWLKQHSMILIHPIFSTLMAPTFLTDSCSVMYAQPIGSAFLPCYFMIHLVPLKVLFPLSVNRQNWYTHTHTRKNIHMYIHIYIQIYFLRFPLTASNRLGTFSKKNTLPPSFLLSLPARNSRASDDLELSPFSISLIRSSPSDGLTLPLESISSCLFQGWAMVLSINRYSRLYSFPFHRL